MSPDRYAPFPLTDQQQAYLVGRTGTFELGNVSTHAYYEYEGELNLARFDRAWQRVIDRHDALRLVIDPEHQRQRVLESVPAFAADVVDLRGAAPAEAERRLAQLRDDMSHEVRPADRYPLFGVMVSRLDDRRSRVHVSFDGLTLDYLSWQLLLADLTHFYDEPDAELPPLELTFRDYVTAEADTRDDAAYRRAEQYWTRRLPELAPSPQLPVRTDPATIDRPRWTSRAGTLPAAAWGNLKRRAGHAGLTPTALTLAVFAETLAAWSDSAQFTVNVPRMNRQQIHPQANEILGEFASFSLLEVEHHGDETFAERAKRLQRRLWDDLAHQQLTGVQVLRELIRGEGGFRRALMPVVFTSTLGFSAGESPLLGHRLPRVFAISQTPQVYLDVQIEEQAADLVYNFDSVDDVFPLGLADELVAAFGRLLHRLATDEDAWTATDLQPVPEHHHTRRGIAGPDRPVPDTLVQTLFERQVALRPDQPAVVADGVTLTYGALYRRANQVGHWLRRHGTEADRPVAVVAAKGPEQIVAAYGALFAGSPYLPVDPNQPPARTAALLDQAGVRLVLTQAHLAALAAGPGRQVLCLDDPAASAGLPDEPLPPTQRADDLAYVLFTSGSTGRPKGAMIEHRGMVNCLRETITAFGVGPGDRCLAVTALHHDMSTFDIFGVLGAGGVVVVPDTDRARDPQHWAQLVAEHGVTLWNSVPAMMEMLLEQGPDLSTLRLVFLGGDWIPLHVPRTLLETVNGIHVVSVGGPTETTLWNIWHPIEKVGAEWRSIPYGRPIANTRYHVLDAWLRDRPEGVTGELYCAGPGLARGYLDDPERTAQAFRHHPVTGERIYRTGDLGRCLPDGTIEFVGRADTQVKIRGQRIELGEVEAALSALPAVRGAAVTAVAHTDRSGYRALAAHVTPAGPVRPDPEVLRHLLRERLPEHMVPALITVLDQLPLTANGKVDRRALAAAPVDLHADAPAVSAPPATALEQVIAGVWEEALGVGAVGVHDDFFAAGGDSILATRIVVRLREALDTPELGLMMLFETVTVAELARAMTAAEKVPGRLEQVAQIYLHVAALCAEDVEAELMGR